METLNRIYSVTFICLCLCACEREDRIPRSGGNDVGNVDSSDLDGSLEQDGTADARRDLASDASNRLDFDAVSRDSGDDAALCCDSANGTADAAMSVDANPRDSGGPAIDAGVGDSGASMDLDAGADSDAETGLDATLDAVIGDAAVDGGAAEDIRQMVERVCDAVVECGRLDPNGCERSPRVGCENDVWAAVRISGCCEVSAIRQQTCVDELLEAMTTYHRVCTEFGDSCALDQMCRQFADGELECIADANYRYLIMPNECFLSPPLICNEGPSCDE